LAALKDASDERIDSLMGRVTIGFSVLLAVFVPAVAAADPSRTDRRNAARECRALMRAAETRANFASMFGTNANDRNAFGKCVSRRAREEERERVSARRNAVRDCRAERAQDESVFTETHRGMTFAEFYGTGPRNRNAFGRCVSSKAREHKGEADEIDRSRVNAAKECRAEQEDTSFASTHEGRTFSEFYGTNESDRNAFGKCVSRKARARTEGMSS
jgi:hypothetical protein